MADLRQQLASAQAASAWLADESRAKLEQQARPAEVAMLLHVTGLLAADWLIISVGAVTGMVARQGQPAAAHGCNESCFDPRCSQCMVSRQ